MCLYENHNERFTKRELQTKVVLKDYTLPSIPIIKVCSLQTKSVSADNKQTGYLIEWF